MGGCNVDRFAAGAMAAGTSRYVSKRDATQARKEAVRAVVAGHTFLPDDAGVSAAHGPRPTPISPAPNERDPLGLFRLAFEEAAHAVIASGENGTILFANRLAASIFAYGTGELAGLPISRILPDACLDATALGPGPVGGGQSVLGVRKDGVTIPVEIGLNVVDKGDSRYVVVCLTDVTERMNLESRLAATAHEELRFERLVSDTAAQFAAVEPDALDDLIVGRLQQIAETLQLDRAILWRWKVGETAAVPVRHWIQPSDQPPPEVFPVARSPLLVSKLRAGEATWFSAADDATNPIDRDTYVRLGLQSAIVLPMTHHGEHSALWFLSFSSASEREWAPVLVERLRLVAGVLSQALARRASQVALKEALDELHHRHAEPGASSVADRPREIKLARTNLQIVSDSAAVGRTLAQIEQVAATPATVLLRGETGAGKEVFAQAIHDLSPRHRRPMVVVSCAAIPAALIESELFGRERGAYTGAISRQIGRFEAAHQSTLFLDEIGDLPAEMQVKLLRVLQERVIERLGSTQSIKVDVRIIAATHRDLEKAVREGAFREDLFYRLNVFPVVVPPLRERVEDIAGLVWVFIDEFSRAFGKTITSISRESMQALERHPWPGNVRELRNVIERAVILATGEQLVVAAPTSSATPLPRTAMTMVALELEHIRSVLDSTNWRVRGRGGAAERLGLKPTTLESRMARLGIARQKMS